MAVLTHDEIQRELQTGRLEITPLAEDQIGPASVDLTLGDEIRVFSPGSTPIPVREDTEPHDYTAPARIDGAFHLLPGATIHGVTREHVRMPRDLCGFLEGRSRFARLGLMIHVTSAFVQPGMSGRQVLEMSNVAGRTLELHAGVRVCQLVLLRAEGEAEYRGRFVEQDGP
ncbi:MAG: dCTP deaminase [Myxococcota bacterium]|nr:dCTP deaminase [Myxococcota bacterium]